LKSLSVDINNELNQCANSNFRQRSILEILKEKLLVYSNIPIKELNNLDKNLSLLQSHKKEIFNKTGFQINKKNVEELNCFIRKRGHSVFLEESTTRENSKSSNGREQNLAYLEIETSND
jgi:hypothetical protein